MLSKLPSRRILIFLLIIVASITALIVYIVILLQPSYVGADAKLSKVDETSSLQISNAVMSMPPKVKSGVQANIQITKFAGNYAQGKVSYSDKSPEQQFMAVKTDESWTIIAHNSGKSLDLPDAKTAEKYHLPKDWFKP